MSHIFGKIEGTVYGFFVRLDPSLNTALVELSLADQAKRSLDKVNAPDRDIVIFRGHDGDGEYMGWRTGSDVGLDVVARHSL
jgi:hypothetical protein